MDQRTRYFYNLGAVKRLAIQLHTTGDCKLFFPIFFTVNQSSFFIGSLSTCGDGFLGNSLTRWDIVYFITTVEFIANMKSIVNNLL